MSGAPTLSRSELRRYSRQLLLSEFAGGQERLKAARVLVIGAGGLGCPVLAYLAGAGVGFLRIADGDTVSLSNLHRQTLYTQADVGRSKAQLAAARLQQVNPYVAVEAAPALSAETAAALLGGVSLVIDASDNFGTRYLVHDLCTAAGLPWVWGAAGGLEGMVSVFGPEFGLRDVFPTSEGAESCDEIGVVGPLLGVVGSVMAMEALKLLTGQPDVLTGRLWTYDALSARVRVVRLPDRTSAAT
ncbi:molybdopterin biosynthesis protein MoeB [Deinococcus irradiatisoli]|uniref:Molybdopterin biosynthesis protein MoeB n=1 Tax=Deinococcus irradiatisoli TaxID=2202254 RepID=A0A2Z3JEP1_9DEIO|nr:HesA/MoeB/ThiF family protein [Deinococcus irradiatisoli]AWN21941.1 molybdopterin biosynthesis protein MoeB [Deinococcus irradiatisoli]